MQLVPKRTKEQLMLEKSNPSVQIHEVIISNFFSPRDLQWLGRWQLPSLEIFQKDIQLAYQTAGHK